MVGALARALSSEGDWLTVEYAELADILVAADGAGLRLLRAEEITKRRVDSFDGTTRLAAVALGDGVGEPLPGGMAAVVDELTARAGVLVAADLVGSTTRASSTSGPSGWPAPWAPPTSTASVSPN